MSRQVPLNMKVLSLVTIPNSVQNQPYTVKTPYAIRAELKYHLILHLKGLILQHSDSAQYFSSVTDYQ